MPEVYVHAIEGRTKEQKRALVKDITDAVVRHFNVTADRVMVEIDRERAGQQGEGRRAVQRPLNRPARRPLPGFCISSLFLHQ